MKDKDGKKPIDLVSPYSDVGKLFGAIHYNKATSLGAVTLLTAAGSIALISGVADAYMGKVWCSTLAAVMAAVALCCTYYAIKTLFFHQGLQLNLPKLGRSFLKVRKPWKQHRSSFYPTSTTVRTLQFEPDRRMSSK